MAPKYRQIPTKTPESYDFNEIPSDFGRMFWLMLPICLDSEGRGVDSIQWLRAKLFPLREDDVTDHVKSIMDWLVNKGMIVRYQVDGRNYFYSVNFKKYQSGTEKEAPSYLPIPPDPLLTNSVVGQEQVRVNAMQCNALSNDKDKCNGNAEAEASENSPTPPASIHGDYVIRVISQVTGLVSIPDDKEKVLPALEGLYYQRDKDEAVLVEYLRPFYQAWIARHYRKTNFAWLYQWAVAGEIPEPRNNGSKTGKQVDTSLDDLIRSGK